MLRHAMLDQRRVPARDHSVPRRMRVAPVPPEKRRKLEHGVGVIADIERGVAGILQERAQRSRKRVRINDHVVLDERGLEALKYAGLFGLRPGAVGEGHACAQFVVRPRVRSERIRVACDNEPG
jgi:hypothetical protein